MLAHAGISNEHARIKVPQDIASYWYEIFEICFRRTGGRHRKRKNPEEASY